jgi:DNA repair photolyase
MPKYPEKCPEQNEIDVYPDCHYNCLYCIAKDKHLPKKNHKPKQEVDACNKQLPFYLSPWTDCYPQIEQETRNTRNILQYLRSLNASYFVITKGTGIYRDADLFKNQKDTFIAISLNSTDSQTQQLFEPDVPSFRERMDLIENLIHEQKVKVVVKIDPVIPGITDEHQLKSLIKWLMKAKPFAVTSETLRLNETIAQRFKANLPNGLHNRIISYYPELNETPKHPNLKYRNELFCHIRDEFKHTDIRTAFCKATLPEPITQNDCRGGFAV